jgi:hypothetical protein
MLPSLLGRRDISIAVVPRMLYEFQKVEGPGGLVLAEHGQRHVALVLLAESARLTAIEDILASVAVPIGSSGAHERAVDRQRVRESA